jgi:diguanylate cyclase (GGDEF)-like protein/PAS domain S-box-containing protein
VAENTSSFNPRFLRRLVALPPLVVLLLGCGLTWYEAVEQQDQSSAQLQADLRQQALQVSAGLQRRLASNAEILRGVAGLFATGRLVDRDAFQRYHDALRLGRDHPGIQGVGFAEWITPEQRARHEAALRAEGHTNYRIRPAGERAHYSAIVLLEPFDWRNQRAFGFDMYTEPVRQAAMSTARDEGRAAITSRVKLVQETDEDVQAGFLLYLPVYAPGLPVGGVEQRRAALRGWAYSPLRAGRFMRSVLDNEFAGLTDRFAVRVYAAAQPRDDQLLFDSAPAQPHTAAAASTTIIQTIHAEGALWALSLQPLPAYWTTRHLEQGVQTNHWLIGLSLTALLVTASVLLADRTRRLVQALEDTTRSRRALAEQHDLLRAIHEGSTVAILMLDRQGRIVHANPRLAEMLHTAPDACIGRPYAELAAPSERAQVQARLQRLLDGQGVEPGKVQRHFRRADGSSFWGEVNGRVVHDADGAVTGAVLVIEDISQRRDDEARIRHLALHDQLTGLANRHLLLDRAGQALDLARRHRRQLALLFIDLDRFKPINDRHGHEAGDAVLRTVAERLQSQLRAADTVCRQGGDEFIVLLSEVSDPDTLPAVADKLLAAIERPIGWQGQALQISASLGIAAYPIDGEDLDTLIRRADTAMYAAKRSGQRVYLSDGLTAPARLD